MNKRGLSAIITTLLVVLLVLVSVGIVWGVVRNIIREGAEEVSLGKFTLNAEITQASIDNSSNNVSVTVERNPGKGELTGIRFVFSDGVNSEVISQTTTLKELGSESFILHLLDLDVDDLLTISIVPIFTSSSGKELFGNVLSVFDVETGDIQEPEEAVCGNNNCDSGETCGDTDVAPECNRDCGNCGGGTEDIYYLDNSATGANNGGFGNDAWQTMADALAGIESLDDNGAGDIIIVSEGIGPYGDIIGPFNIGWTAYRTDWLTFRAALGENPVINSVKLGEAVSTISDMYLNFEGITFGPGDANRDFLVHAFSVNHLMFNDCEFSGDGYILRSSVPDYVGLKLTQTNYVVVNNCIFGPGTAVAGGAGNDFAGTDAGIECDRLGGIVNSDHVNITNSQFIGMQEGIRHWGNDWNIIGNSFEVIGDGIKLVGSSNINISGNYFNVVRPFGTDQHCDAIQAFSDSAGSTNRNPRPEDVDFTNIFIENNEMYVSAEDGSLNDLHAIMMNNFYTDYAPSNMYFRNNVMVHADDIPDPWESNVVQLDDHGAPTITFDDIYFIDNTMIGSINLRGNVRNLRLINNLATEIDVWIDSGATVVDENRNIVHRWGSRWDSFTHGTDSLVLSNLVDFQNLFVDYGNRGLEPVMSEPACDGTVNNVGVAVGALDCVGGEIITGEIIADHNAVAAFDQIPDYWLEQARKLTMHYVRTSHGSQILAGLLALERIDPLKYAVDLSNIAYVGSPTLPTGEGFKVLTQDGGPDDYFNTQIGIDNTRLFAESELYNFSMLAMCAELQGVTQEVIDLRNYYVESMSTFRADYPDMDFIHMTGRYYECSNYPDPCSWQGYLEHYDYIRDHVIATDGILFDFAYIEAYDPDGNYHSEEDGTCLWCVDWCNDPLHINDPECIERPTDNGGGSSYTECAHSHGLNCVNKAKAFWWLMARFAGWDGTSP